MSDVTLEGIAKLLKEEFEYHLSPINTRLTAIETTLEVHTKALDQLLKEKKARDEEKTIAANRFDRLEHWAVLAGEKLGIKLEL